MAHQKPAKVWEVGWFEKAPGPSFEAGTLQPTSSKELGGSCSAVSAGVGSARRAPRERGLSRSDGDGLSQWHRLMDTDLLSGRMKTGLDFFLRGTDRAETRSRIWGVLCVRASRSSTRSTEPPPPTPGSPEVLVSAKTPFPPATVSSSQRLEIRRLHLRLLLTATPSCLPVFQLGRFIGISNIASSK